MHQYTLCASLITITNFNSGDTTLTEPEAIEESMYFQKIYFIQDFYSLQDDRNPKMIPMQVEVAKIEGNICQEM